MQHKEAKKLLKKYREGICSKEELALLETWYLRYEDEPISEIDAEAVSEQKLNIWKMLPVHQHLALRPRKMRWPWMAAAAVVLCLILAVLFTTGDKQLKPQLSNSEILPGGNNAVLTLANGQKILLNDASNGDLANQSGITVSKTDDGQLVYQVSPGTAGANVSAYNTIVTPMGGQYRISLPDGTKVWLNSASSMTFPLAFSEGERRVSLTGEGYFEVAYRHDQPFKVVSGRQTVEVLGTHFNINSYADEPALNTTLVEGSVKVKLDNEVSTILKPGQQAVVLKEDIKVKSADVEVVTAWVNGDFNFKDENIQSIMRKLKNWYDIDVIYEGKPSDVDFGAEISRNRNLSQVLKILEETGNVHFKVEGRRVTVMP